MQDSMIPSPVQIVNSCLLISFELGNRHWKLGFSDGQRERIVQIDARNCEQLDSAIEKTRHKWKLDDSIPIYSCYEAGRDGFWLHRYLESCEIHNHVVDSSSIEVSRKRRRAKTDRLDAQSLLRLLLRYLGGERKAFRVLHIPEPEAEDERCLHRDVENLLKERGMHQSRMQSLLVTQGLSMPTGLRFLKQQFLEWIERVPTQEGRGLGSGLKAQLRREHQRWALVQQQIETVRKQQREALKSEVPSESLNQVRQFTDLRGIGPVSAWLLVYEFFGWRQFANVKQVGSAAGLTPSPYESGSMNREQGISKAGNRRIRSLMIQLAWRWLQFQPDSALSQWFQQRFAHASNRFRKIGIVALARKLLIALWKYQKDGIVPQGALRMGE